MSKHILVVDDSATMTLSLRNSLELAGFTVSTAGDGVKGLERLRMAASPASPKPDLIITDINMPNMGGLEFIQHARALPGFRFTPLLVLSTESQAERRDQAKKLGATGWMVKPVGAADLVKIVKQVLPGA